MRRDMANIQEHNVLYNLRKKRLILKIPLILIENIKDESAWVTPQTLWIGKIDFELY